MRQKGEGAPTCMNLYLRCSASAKSHLRLHLSRLPPLPADIWTGIALHTCICSLMQPQVAPCTAVAVQAFIYSLMQPRVGSYLMMSQCAAGSCLQDILSGGGCWYGGCGTLKGGGVTQYLALERGGRRGGGCNSQKSSVWHSKQECDIQKDNV